MGGGHQKKIPYPEIYKDATGKGLWSGKDNEVSQWERDVWGNINMMDSWRDLHYIGNIL